MRTVLSFVFTTFIIIGSSAQSLRIGAVFQPDLTYFTVSPDGSSLASDFKLLNKPTINYQTGILVFYDISDKLTLVGGLTYSRRGFEAQFNTSTISGFNFGSGYSLKITDRYLEIPLVINYHLTRFSKIKWFVSGGIKPAIYLNSMSKATGILNSPSDYYYNAHRKANLFATLGFGAEITIIKRWQLVIWPSLEHALLKEVYAAPLSLYPYSLGLNVCLVYSLGN